MELSKVPESAHIEYNEDGRIFHHPGYVFRKCDICGKYFITAKGIEGKNCGSFACSEKNDR